MSDDDLVTLLCFVGAFVAFGLLAWAVDWASGGRPSQRGGADG